MKNQEEKIEEESKNTAEPAAEETVAKETAPAAEEAIEEAAVAAAGESGGKATGSGKNKKVKIHGKKIAIIVLSSILAVIILTVGLLFGIGSCNKSGLDPVKSENSTTVRKEVPTDGTTPEDHTALDNIAFMAYVLDHQQFYHAYANNSTRATGYEQVTRTWKDYKVQEVEGQSRGIMICSDLSYSLFVKSASQACFVDNKVAYMRTGSGINSSSTVTDINWNTDQPSKYTKEEYLKIYGEFSTELSVYAINKSTVESAGEVINNSDGTYSQKFVLNPGAACWYQYGMKTRGGLKTYPVFKKIEITFTFDNKWQVLSSYCEESTSIAPGALGGLSMDSDSKTTTTFDYSAQNFDTAHFGYFDSYYSEYLDKDIVNSDGGNNDVELTEVLMGGFRNVISESGQQFALNLKLGETEYDGKIYLKLTDLSDALNNLDLRLSLGKKGSGRQDLYVQFSKGVVDLYYSDGFALTADIDKVSASVKAFSEWIKGITAGGEQEGGVAVQAEGGLDLSALLNSLKVEPTKLTPEDTAVKISIDTDDLLGLGIGVNLEMNFDRSVSDGMNVYDFNNLKLNSLAYDSKGLALGAAIVPDETEIITHNPAEAPADLADYIDGVLALANSKSYTVSLNLDGTTESIAQLHGLTLDATAQVELGSDYKSIKVSAPVSVTYENLSVELSLYYTVNLESGDYGDIYVNLTNVCGKEVSAKVCCNIKDPISSVNKLISMFTPSEEETQADEPTEQTSLTVAEIINTVLNLDFGAIVTELKADANEIKVSVNADEVLKTVLAVLNKQFNIELGTATISVALSDGKVSLGGSVSALGLALGISGSDEAVSEINTAEYADITLYVDGIYNLLNSKAYSIDIKLDGTCNSIEYLENVTAQASALVKLSDDYKNIEVSISNLTVNYQGLNVVLKLYYTINLDNGGYGKVYVNLSEIGGKKVDVNVYCDINDTVTAVTSLIDSFKGASESPAPAAVYANVADTVLSIDFGAIITELKVSAEEVKLGVDADEILNALNVSLGLNIGEVSLSLGLNEGKASLSGSVDSLGLSLAVNGSDDEIDVPDINEYLDATVFVNGVAELLESNSFAVTLELDGTCESIEYIKGVKVTANALVSLSKDFKEIQVYVQDLSVTYKDLTVVLDANYSINLANGGFGTVYLHVKNIGGAEVSAKVYCNIEETVEAVNQIIGMFVSGNTSSAAVYAESESNKVADIIGTIVSIDYKAIINELTADNTGINLAVNAEEILKLLKIDIKGIELGEVSVSVNLDSDNKLNISGGAKTLGLTLGISGSDETIPDAGGDYADLTSYVNGVYKLLNSNTYNVKLVFDGSECAVLNEINNAVAQKASAYVKDVTAETTAQVKLSPDFKTITVNAPITVIYDKKLSVELGIYYTIEIGNGYGTAYVILNKINEQEFFARVKCDINEVIPAVKELIDLFTSSSQPAAASAVSEVVDKVVSIDFSKIISLLTADNMGVNLTVNADELLSAFKVNLGSVQLGEVKIELGIDDSKCATLTGSVPAVGLTELKLNGSGDDIVTIDTAKYFDIVEIIQLVKEATVEVKNIINDNAIVFNVEKASLTVDGIKMSVSGNGEIIWAGNTLRVALDLTFAIEEGEVSEDIKIKFVYDEAQTATHLVRFTIGNTGLVIDKKDIDGVSTGLNKIIDIVNSVINGKTQSPDAANFTAEESGEGEEKTDNLTKIVNAVLKFVSELKVELQTAESEEAIKSLVISYKENGVLSLGTNGGLGLSLLVKNDNGTEIADIKASVRAPYENEDKFTALDIEFAKEEYTFYTSESQDFIKAVYNYVFAVLKDLSVKNILGSDTYTVTVNLDGNASGIKELEGITVKAEIYYTETEGKKLVEIELKELNIKGTAVEASAYYYDNYFYVVLRQIGETKLYNSFENEENNKPLAFKASKDNIYLAAESLVGIITSDNVPAILALFKGDAAAAATLSESGEIPATGNNVQLTNIVNSLFKLAISFQKEGEENTLTINIDEMLKDFVKGVSIGEVKIAVNPKTHAISASATKNEIAWIQLNAFADENSKHGKAPAKEDYIDIDFVATLLSDIEATIDSLGKREDGKPDLRISLTGDVAVKIKYSAIGADVEIKNVVLTAGLDENDKFYFTLTGELQKSTAKLSILPLPVTVADNWKISVTYSNGYITMGRELGTANVKYKVMPLAYLIDNILDKNDSPIRWLLGTNSTVWGLVCDNVKLPKNDDKQEYYLYEHQTETPEKTPKTDTEPFNLAEMLLGLNVKLGDSYTSTFGTAENVAAAISKFSGLTDNYYALNLNLSSLIGNTLSELNAAIVRNANGGLKGVNAYAALDGGYLTATVRLDKSLTDNHAEDYYKTVNPNGEVIDFGYFDKDDTKVFGCYSTEKGTYSHSDNNVSYTLNVYDFGGETYANCPVNVKADILNEKHANVSLKSGSTVYLFENEVWLDEEQTRKVVYVDENGNDLGLRFIIRDDINIYMMVVGRAEIKFFDEDENACNVNGAESNIKYDMLTGEELPAPKSLTVTKNGTGYTFAGWYTEKECENLVTSVQAGVSSYYAKYVLTTVTENNGVTYTFGVDNGYHYTATGLVNNYGDGDNKKDYSDPINTLIIADYINGYPVTTIKEGAFHSRYTGINLKKVVVPATVIMVGAEAFRDNKGMISAVFLADKITFGGDSYGKDGSRYVFLGCAKEGNDNVTELKVYYNLVVDSHTNWMGYKKGNNNNSGSNMVERVNLFPAGTWAYVDFTVNNFADELPKLKSGIVTEVFDIEEYVTDILNSKTYEDGYINKYDITVEGSLELNGSRYTINVTITEKENVADYWYELNLSCNDANSTLSYVWNDAAMLLLENKTFVKTGSEVQLELNIAKGYEFNGWETEETVSENNVFNMPAHTVSITLNVQIKPAERVYVYSEVGFKYNEVKYENANIEGGVRLTNAALGAGLFPAYALEENYTFLGWATLSGEDLAFSTAVVPEVETADVLYYAIWALHKDITSAEVLTSGNDIKDITVTTEQGTVYSWHEKDADILTAPEVTVISTTQTVFKARMEYTVTATFEAGNTWVVYNRNKSSEPTVSSHDGQVMSNNDSKKEQEFKLLEGQTINISRRWSNALIIEILNADGSQEDSYMYFAYYKKSIISRDYSKRDILEKVSDNHYIIFINGTWNDENGNVVTNDVKIAASGSDHLFGANTVNGNASFTIHF